MIDDFLCIDVLLELFRYFYIDEIVSSFDEVIRDLPGLLRQSRVPLHVCRIDKHFRRFILPHIDCARVVSIRIPNLYRMASVDLGRFHHLHSLTLGNVTTKNWPGRLPQQLRSLVLFVRSRDRQEVFHRSLRLAHIERLEFHSTFLHFRECGQVLPKPSTVKHLIFSSRRCFIDYDFLANNLPHLHTLKVNLAYYPHRFEAILSRFSSLHTLVLSSCYIDIEEMISFLSQITGNSLRRCQLVNIKSSLSPDIALVLISWLFRCVLISLANPAFFSIPRLTLCLPRNKMDFEWFASVRDQSSIEMDWIEDPWRGFLTISFCQNVLHRWSRSRRATYLDRRETERTNK